MVLKLQNTCQVLHLQLPVVLPHGLQESIILLSLVGFEAQISLQTLLLSLQTLHTFIIIIIIFTLVTGWS